MVEIAGGRETNGQRRSGLARAEERIDRTRTEGWDKSGARRRKRRRRMRMRRRRKRREAFKRERLSSLETISRRAKAMPACR